MKKIMKSKKGITLISLVVTIIILLILAGISIGMLSGDNSIIGQAGNAKTQTDIAEEKEIIDLAVVHAIGKSKYGDIDETYFTNELEKNNATVTKSGSKYKVTFSSGRQYEVDQDGNVKEKKFNPNALEISELNENGSTYFGWDVINYAKTLPAELQDTKWQLFYAGALDGETEERIYLISKEYVKNALLPAKDGAKTIEGSNEYNTKFATNDTNGIMPKYSGSSNITELKIKNLNKKYFDFLNDDTSENPNMKAVAYMMDTTIWKSFAESTEGYAEYAIGGPTVELLFTAYNKYKNKSLGNTYEARVIDKNGYQIRKNSGFTFSSNIDKMIENDTNSVNSPYSVSNLTSQTTAYWLASPSAAGGSLIMDVNSSGNVSNLKYGAYYGNSGLGVRPIVCLDLSFTLEKTKDSNNKDAFRIVEK